MRILHLITNLGVGGAETMLVRILAHQLDTGSVRPEDHPVAFFHDGPIRQQLEQRSVPVYHLRGRFLQYDPTLVTRIVLLVRQLMPDIIHSSLWSANLVARCVGWWTKTPVICDLHSNCAHHGLVRRTIDWLPLPRPAAVVAVSEHVRQAFVRSRGGRALRDRTEVITNGIDMAQFAFSPAARDALRKQLMNRIMGPELCPGPWAMPLVVGAVGRLVPIKRYDLLIEAFARFSRGRAICGVPLWLCLVGDGPSRKSLETKAQQCGVADSVLFIGESNNVAVWYSAFDCLAVTSQSEGLSLAVLEALASGLPVLTTGEDGIHEVVQTGVNGIVLKNNSVCQIACGLEQVLRVWCVPGAQRPSLLAQGFDLCHVASAYNQLYMRISVR